ncbi:YezD family protein [Gorillibacterium sp. sgz500922]|uniref:YezD family protein n=1 Tax=Gorillibacterium sp. sgz500922 TaxID=3446694 RepID=UPI003F66B9C8
MAKPLEVDDEWNERILSSLNGMEYGAVQIIVHDGKIVQIERTERKRFDSASEKRSEAAAREGARGPR